MGLFDFFKRKKKDEAAETQSVAAQTETSTVQDDDDSAPGWEAIDAAFQQLYPNQTNPKHYGTVVSYRFGGPDPLDGISVYDAGDFWHFVSYGLSDLYEKETDDPDYSGFGLEFTFKLKKAGLADEEEEIRGVCATLQKLARYTFQTGNIIFPVEYIYTRQTTGIDVGQQSKLTGFITEQDDLVGPIDTPFGRVTFVTLIGTTDAELKHINESDQSKLEIQKLLDQLGTQVTDYDRESI